jgi:8-oxo-dGTP diphosphatase
VGAAYKNPALTVDAVWIRRGRVLLVRRARAPFRDRWALPGGYVELRETVEETVVRELREETGLAGRPFLLVGVYSGPDRNPLKPTTTVAFLMRGQGGIPHGGDDALEASWVRLVEARDLAFDHDRILRDARRRIRSIRDSRRSRLSGRRSRRGGSSRRGVRKGARRQDPSTRRAPRRSRG